jgi:hypothetical protein
MEFADALRFTTRIGALAEAGAIIAVIRTECRVAARKSALIYKLYLPYFPHGSFAALSTPKEKAARKPPCPAELFELKTLKYGYVLCLEALRPLDNAELHSLTLWKALEATRLNR